MKRLIFVIAIFIIASCTSCNSSSASKAANKENASTDNTTSSSVSGDAIFSYSLDGAKVSGGEVDELQINNSASITQSDPGGRDLVFFLNDEEQKNTETVAHSLRFTIPDKTGTVQLTEDQQNNWNVELFLPSGEEGKYTVYGNESFSITLANISSTRVSGTFSGKLKAAIGAGSGKSEVSVTDGKFDIPIRHDQK